MEDEETVADVLVTSRRGERRLGIVPAVNHRSSLTLVSRVVDP